MTNWVESASSFKFLRFNLSRLFVTITVIGEVVPQGYYSPDWIKRGRPVKGLLTI